VIDLPLLRHWALVARTPLGGTVHEVFPDVTLELAPLRPLPPDLKAWGDHVVFRRVKRTAYRVRNVEDLTTDAGWPVTFFTSDVMVKDTRQVYERRLHALFLFLYHGGVATVRSRHPERFDAAIGEVRPVLLKGRPRWKTEGEIGALSEIWEGLDLERDQALLAVPIAKEAEQVE